MSIKKQVSIHGRRVHIGTEGHLVSKNGIATGGGGDQGTIVYASPSSAAAFQDFVTQFDDTGKAFPGGWRAVAGDTGHAFNIAARASGVLRLFSGISAGAAKTSAAGQGISQGGKFWKGNQGTAGNGNLRFAARIRPESASRDSKRLHVFAGFTDFPNYEFPAYDTGAGVISAAANYMGFMLSPGGDTGWSAAAGKSTAGDSGDQVVSLDPNATANKWVDLELHYLCGEGDTGGRVDFYIDGQAKGSIVSPIKNNEALNPVVYAFQQDTGGEYLDIDWINVSAPRDTGE